MYSMELSLFVLDAGIKLLEMERRDLMYLSLTDFVQHKFAPSETEARRFYQELDRRFGRLEELGAMVALTADHGMNDKSNAAGKPNVIWLQDILDAKFGTGDTRVICPITDAFVAHHGALGGFVRVWCRGKATPREIIDVIRGIEGIESVLDKATACRCTTFRRTVRRTSSSSRRPTSASAPPRPTMTCRASKAIGCARTAASSEAKVPMILSRPLNDAYKLKAAVATPKSYQLFDFAINGTAAA